MYMQVVGVLVVLLLLYYATMIALDIQKQKSAKAAELENSSEIDIDISDEAQTFKPVYISRDEPMKVVTESSDDKLNSESLSGKDVQKENNEADSMNMQSLSEVSQREASDDFPESSTASHYAPASQPETYEEQPFRRPGYREPVMTDGVPVEVLLDTVNRLAETGESDLGSLIYRCESSRVAS